MQSKLADETEPKKRPPSGAPTVERHIGRIARVREALARAKTDERKAALQAELDASVAELTALRDEINGAI